MNKNCTKCHKTKTLVDFNLVERGSLKRRSECRKCAMTKMNNQHLIRKYGIDKEDFEVWLAAQNGQCRICKTTDPSGQGTFKIDHCHTSKSLRGLLCHLCNIGLGAFKDNPSLLREAALYLERTKRPSATDSKTTVDVPKS